MQNNQLEQTSNFSEATRTENDGSVKTLHNQHSGSMTSEEDYDAYFLNVEKAKTTTTSENNNNNNSTISKQTPIAKSMSNTISVRSNSSSSSSGVRRTTSNNSNNSKFSIANWTNSNSFLSDEDVEHLRLDEKLKSYKQALENNYNNKSDASKGKSEITITQQEQNVTERLSQKSAQPLNAENLLSNELIQEHSSSASNNNNGSNSSNTRPQFRVPAFFVNRK